MLGGCLHSVLREYTDAVMCPENVPVEFGEYSDGLDESHFLRGVDGGDDTDGYTE